MVLQELQAAVDVEGSSHKGLGHKKPRSRAGSKSEAAVLKAKKHALSDSLAVAVTLDGTTLKSCWNFKYLGYTFQADGEMAQALLIRMAAAWTAFGSLHHIWRCKELQLKLKLQLYLAVVTTVMTHGHEAWPMTAALCSKVKGWNAKALSIITGRSIVDECRDPTHDLLAHLRARRLRWAGHILRQPDDYLLKAVILAQCAQQPYPEGHLLMDVPPHAGPAQLQEMVDDKEEWNMTVNSLTVTTNNKN